MPRDAESIPPLPPTLTEELICDLVEGLLPASEAERVRRALAQSPQWSQRVAQMESHRRVLALIPDEPPPTDLLDRVQAALERDALLSLSHDERNTPSIVVMQPARDGGVLARLAPRLWRPLAVAAGIALLALGGIYWARNLSRHGASPAPVVLHPTPDEHATAIAMAEPSAEPPVITPEAPAKDAPTGMSLAEAEPTRPDLTPGRALALAREGRLLVRVIAEKASAAESAIAAIASLRGDPVRGLTVEREVPAEVLAAVSQPRPVVVGPASRQRPEAALASERPITPFDPLALVPPGVLSPWLPIELPPALGRTFVLELPGTPASFDAMHRALGARLGRQVRIVYEELTAPAVPAPVDAASLLWWTGPASTWAPRLAVPLVVEHQR
jgi:hypothetical protein